MMAAVSLPKSPTEASALFSTFLLAARPGLEVVLHDSDADGLAAGVLLAIGLSRLGRTRPERASCLIGTGACREASTRHPD